MIHNPAAVEPPWERALGATLESLPADLKNKSRLVEQLTVARLCFERSLEALATYHQLPRRP